jgi:hypothetical protein
LREGPGNIQPKKHGGMARDQPTAQPRNIIRAMGAGVSCSLSTGLSGVEFIEIVGSRANAYPGGPFLAQKYPFVIIEPKV